jgi:hypothetical protein
MKAHALAKLLLNGPDIEVAIAKNRSLDVEDFLVGSIGQGERITYDANDDCVQTPVIWIEAEEYIP